MNMRLRELRKAKGLSQYALAVAARTSPSTVVYVEAHNHRPRPDLQQRIAAALDTTPEALWPPAEEAEREVPACPTR
ncbi:MAG: helix-turn-helix transcriptional regulator [Anaerolineae bacterium]